MYLFKGDSRCIFVALPTELRCYRRPIRLNDQQQTAGICPNTPFATPYILSNILLLLLLFVDTQKKNGT